MTPVMMPENAVGSTTLTIVFHLGTPSAYDASRSSFGTSLSISSVERTTTGIIRSTSASAHGEADPLEPEGRDPDRVDEQAATIEGMPVMMSTMKLTARASLPRPYSTR